MPRPLRLGLVALGVLAFLLISAALARVLGVVSAERGVAVRLVKAQSGGDVAQVTASIRGCRRDPACRRRMAQMVSRLRSGETVRVLRFDGPESFPLGAGRPVARIAWRAGDALPLVQCVTIARSGDLLHGFEVAVTGLSAPIGREAGCPGA